MGDRGNIVIEKDNRLFLAPLYFYTHWSGYQIKQTLQKALEIGRDRWGDPSYLARIIFCTLVGPSTLAATQTTGFGISNTLCDNEHPLLCVHIPEKKVRLRGAPNWNAKTDPMEDPVIQEWTFEEFLAAKFEDEE